MKAIVFALVAAGCGRVDFDAHIDAGADAAAGSAFAAFAAVQTGSIAELAFDPIAGTVAEIAPRITLATAVDSIAFDQTGSYVLAAGGILTSYAVEADDSLVLVATDGGSQYSTTLRMRLAFHPALPWFYMSGDGPGSTNVLLYQLQPTGMITEEGAVGTEATPVGVAVDASGAILYTTSGLATAQVCAHAINDDGTLGPMQGCIATCGQPLELFAFSDRVVVVCTSGTIAIHPLDTSMLPTAMMSYDAGSAIRAARRSASGLVDAVTATDELVRVDPSTATEVDRTPVRTGTLGFALSPDQRYVIGSDPLGVAVYDAGVMLAATPSDIGGAAISVIAR